MTHGLGAGRALCTGVEDPDVVTVYLVVSGDEGHRLQLCLGNEEPVERVAVMVWKLG